MDTIWKYLNLCLAIFRFSLNFVFVCFSKLQKSLNLLFFSLNLIKISGHSKFIKGYFLERVILSHFDHAEVILTIVLFY